VSATVRFPEHPACRGIIGKAPSPRPSWEEGEDGCEDGVYIPTALGRDESPRPLGCSLGGGVVKLSRT
jgi:hypothetical protein